MKMIISMVAFAASTLFGLQSCEKNDELINGQDLPNTTQSWVTSNFPDATIVRAEKDYDDGTYTYKVTLSDGTFIEFRKNGEWKEIENRVTGVPESALPVKIAEYLKANYAEYFVVEIEKERGYDVELNNDLDLDFDKDGNFVRIDY